MSKMSWEYLAILLPLLAIMLVAAYFSGGC